MAQATLCSNLGLPSLPIEEANRYLLFSEQPEGNLMKNLDNPVTSLVIEASAFLFRPSPGQSPVPNEAQCSTHFVVRLHVADHQSAIRLDTIQPQRLLAQSRKLGSRVAVMRVSVSQGGSMKTNSTQSGSIFLDKSAPIPVKNAPTFQAVLDALFRAGVHRYRLTANGSGCRFWCQRVIDTPIKEGYVEEKGEHRRCVDTLLDTLRAEAKRKRNPSAGARSGDKEPDYDNIWLPSRDEQAVVIGRFFQRGEEFDLPYTGPNQKQDEAVAM